MGLRPARIWALDGATEYRATAALLAGRRSWSRPGFVMALLPQLGHLAFNEQTYGNHATETPLPLTNPKGKIVYPGFPADVLFNFRLYSVAAQLPLWSVIGLVFGALRRAGRR